MKRVLRWIGFVTATVAGLAIITFAVVYVLSQRVMRRTYEVPAVDFSVPLDSASIIEGRRLAIIRGCYGVGGCHGAEAQGEVVVDDPILARLVAPNLRAAVHKYSDRELAGIIRNGVRPDGHSVLVMPSEAFVGLSDRDLGRIIAFLRSLPPVKGLPPRVELGPLGRVGFAIGKFKLAAQLIAETVPPPPGINKEAAFGRYLATTTCPQCHAANLHGASTPAFTSPSLQIVAGYSTEAFTRLLRTGVPLGGRSLPMMGPWARGHLSYFTDEEIAALYQYLHALPPSLIRPR